LKVLSVLFHQFVSHDISIFLAGRGFAEVEGLLKVAEISWNMSDPEQMSKMV